MSGGDPHDAVAGRLLARRAPICELMDDTDQKDAAVSLRVMSGPDV